MAEARYVMHDAGHIDQHEVFEQDLSEWGVRRPVSFNVDWVPEDQREWLLGVLSKSFEETAKAAHEAGIAKVRREVKKALGL